MKYPLYTLLACVSGLGLSSTASAQCYQNGVPCGQTQSTPSGAPIAGSTGTVVMGTDGSVTVPLLTDGTGRVIVNVNTLPALPTGSNTIGTIGNTGFAINGTLPGFASVPTFNLGTLNGAATDTNLTSVKTTLGSPFQAGGSIGNTAFGISGTLPAFAATPTFNLGTAPNLTTNTLGAVTTAAPAYTTGTNAALSLTTSGALRVDTGGTSQTVSGTVTANIGTTNGLALDTTVNGLFKSGQSIGNTAFAISGTLPGYAATPTFNLGTSPTLTVNGQAAVTTAVPAYTNGTNAALSLTTSGALRVDSSTTTQPVSGTVNANIISAPIITTLTQGLATTTAPTYTNGNGSLLSLTLNGGLRVDGSGTTQPVSGTVGITALPTGTNTIGNVLKAIPYNESSIPLGASATFTGTSRDVGAAVGTAIPWNTFGCFVITDKAGTLNMQGSNDNTTWYNEQTQTVAVNVPVTLSVRIFTRYHRCQIVNTTASAETVLFLNSQLGQ